MEYLGRGLSGELYLDLDPSSLHATLWALLLPKALVATLASIDRRLLHVGPSVSTPKRALLEAAVPGATLM